MNTRVKLILLTVIFCLLAGFSTVSAWESQLVYFGGDGKLVYDPEPVSGHRIGDFSHAGYMGGGVDLPTVPTVLTISPIAGDNAAHIQSAIDTVSAMTPDENGIRGALLLEQGLYTVHSALYVTASGVVIRGEGSGGGDTVIYRAQDYDLSQGSDWDCPAYQEGVLIFQGVGGTVKFNHYISGTGSLIIDDYVPVGSRVFHVDHPEHYNVGDRVVIDHPDTWDWLYSVDRGGCGWDPGMVNINAVRRVVAKNGNAIAVDAPIFFDIDRSLTQATMTTMKEEGRINNVGIEDILVDIETDGDGTDDHSCFAVKFRAVDDSWALRAAAKHFQIAGFQFTGSHRMTVRECYATKAHYDGSGGRGYNFYHLYSQQMLIENCYANDGRHAYVCNGSGRDNCNVYLNNIGEDNQYASEGHYRWINGLLFDGHYENSNSWNHIGFQRMGCDHGWATVHSVAWNCTLENGGTIIAQRPPGAQNYAIGCDAVVTGGGVGSWQDGPDGWFEGTKVSGLNPSSLYQAQLAERLANPVDITPPAPPASAAATPANAQVWLSWSANSETDFAGYNLYRSTTQGSGYTKINTSLLTSTTYTDDTVVNDTTYYYVLSAEDAFSNESAYSAEMTATPSLGGYGVDTFYAVADSWINDNILNKDTVYGNDDDIQTRDEPAETYIKFTTTGLYGTVNSATLRVYCYVAEDDKTRVYAVSNNNWDEDTLTFNNSPLDLGSELDNLDSSAVGWYEFDVTSHITGNGTFTIGMDQDESTKQKYYAKEYDSGNYAPELIVDYGTPPSLPVVVNSSATNITTSAARLNGEVADGGGEIPAVTVYWGDNDGGTTAGNWDNAVSLGDHMGQFYTDISSLTDGTTYYYRCYAVNAEGGSWAESTAAFTTSLVISSPWVENTPATDITYESATLNGEVVDNGNEDPQVIIYWGDNDGGMDPASWDNYVNLGNQGSTFSTAINSLSPLTTYYYRAYASNTAGISWASETGSFTSSGVTAPTVVNVAATDIEDSFATLNGQVTSTGGEVPNVIIYWGTTDGGTTIGNWQNSWSIGLQSSEFSEKVEPLVEDTTYYYRAFAYNTVGYDWADTTSQFTTVIVTLPTVTVQPPEDISDNTAKLWGELTDDGGGSCYLRFYYGYQDGGTNPDNWDFVINKGDAEIGLFKKTLDGVLYSGTTYYYRTSATNSAGTDWSDNALSFTTTGTPTVFVNVPDVTGQARASAQGDIVSDGLVVGAVSAQISQSLSAGYVISQIPDAGELVAEGTSVDLVFSNGDGSADLSDFLLLSKYWLDSCTEANNWCESIDYDLIDGVEFDDLYEFASRWLNGL